MRLCRRTPVVFLLWYHPTTLHLLEMVLHRFPHQNCRTSNHHIRSVHPLHSKHHTHLLRCHLLHLWYHLTLRFLEMVPPCYPYPHTIDTTLGTSMQPLAFHRDWLEERARRSFQHARSLLDQHNPTRFFRTCHTTLDRNSPLYHS